MKTSILASVGTCAILAAGAALMAPLSPHAQGAAPRYEFDASWNKPFPNRWINGGLGGLCVDGNDHVLVLNRQDVNRGELAAGAVAPPMLEFDSAGNLVHSWGDPKVIDQRLHSCHYRLPHAVKHLCRSRQWRCLHRRRRERYQQLEDRRIRRQR